MTTYDFLTAPWCAQAHTIRQQLDPTPVQPRHRSVIQLVVSGGSPDPIYAYIDSLTGFLEIDLGQAPNADVTVYMTFADAKAILVTGDAQAGMQAFMAGRITVNGDMTKLMALQQSGADQAAVDIAAAIRAMTA